MYHLCNNVSSIKFTGLKTLFRLSAADAVKPAVGDGDEPSVMRVARHI